MKDYLSIDIGGTMIKYAHIDSSGIMIEKMKLKQVKIKKSFFVI